MGHTKKKRVLVFLPDTLQRDRVGFLTGFTGKCEDTQAFFVLKEKLNNDSVDSIGYVSEVTPENQYNSNAEWLHINSKTDKIKICGNETDYCVTSVRYNYNSFVKSEAISLVQSKHGVFFETLVRAIKNRCVERNQIFYRFVFVVLMLFGVFTRLLSGMLNVITPLVKYSAILTQIQINVSVTKWLLESLHSERKITLKIGNVIVSKITDFVLGLILLYFFFEYEQEILIFIRDVTETVIQGIKQLLIILMGSPVGLKLNFAFSQNLGKFFLYHITLWETFLLVTKFMMKYALRLLVIPGIFGLTYQAALISDLISFATFHVYCIYVYAARLYGLQIKGIISLSKLFVGRKFNPLRNRVDSLQYTQNQLFVGTLGFTILLFLLPTTLLYYSVFTVLRLILNLTEAALLFLRHFLQCLPIYVTLLWLMRSQKIAGNITLQLNEETATLQANLKPLPLSEGVTKCCPDVLPDFPKISCGKLIRSVFIGVVL